MELTEETVDRRRGLTYEAFRKEYLEPRRPVIIEDAIDHWRAKGKWTQPLPIYTQPNWMSSRYPRLWPFDKGMPRAMKRMSYLDVNFTGPGKDFPVLHLDMFGCHAMICQLYGDKRFYAFGPDQTPYLYPKRRGFGGGAISKIADILDPDEHGFPEFQHARGTSFVLHAGESLFNPTGWWHTTKTLSPSIAAIVSFANASNWVEVVREMARAVAGKRSWLFAPYFAYLLARGMATDPRTIKGTFRNQKLWTQDIPRREQAEV